MTKETPIISAENQKPKQLRLDIRTPEGQISEEDEAAARSTPEKRMITTKEKLEKREQNRELIRKTKEELAKKAGKDKIFY